VTDAHQYDVHIIAYTSLFRILNNFHQEVFSDPNVPNGLNRSIDFRAVTLEHDQQLTNYRQEWAERFERDSNHAGSCHPLLRCLSSAFPDIALIFSDHDTDAACVFRVKLLPLYVAESSPVFVLSDSPARFALFSRCSYANYARLVMFSFGFQKAFQRGFEPDDEVFFTRVRILL
jgi:hypothetical protein